ncbi:MAG: tetratricopeptide repeat protein [SAR324 cluster bacterium]|nr:tetratricopeptide repeat protein [SAR324 cluster bacterium]
MKILLIPFFSCLLGLLALPIAANPFLKAQVSFQRGNTYLRTLQYDHAIRAYSRAIALRANHAQAYHKRGTAYYFSSQWSQACGDWKKACELDFSCMGLNFGIYRKVCKKNETKN